MAGTCAAGDACIEVDVAIAFVDGALTAPQRAEIEQRIDACAACRAIVAAAARDLGEDRPTAIDPPGAPTVSERRAQRRMAIDSSHVVEPGVRIGRYIVERALGAGGMGVVSLARDPELRRAVVIKLVRPDALGDELEARLQREAQAQAQLSHPNVVQIFDIGRHGDRVFLAMEFVPGQTLDAWLIERARSRDEILAMFCQAGAGLDAAHRAGLVHRDFKPANVLVDRDGIAKVTDFGLARGLNAPNTKQITAPRVSGVHAVLTHADAVLGTPAYMAPEQAEGRAVDARSDQYALAVALLDALLGQSPVERTALPDASIGPALDKAGVPARVRRAIARALQADPEARFPSVAELLRELAPRDRRRVPLVAGLALCIAALVVWFATHRQEAPACTAGSPGRWSAAVRARVVAAAAASPRPFESWTGEALATAIDRAVERLAAAEIATCEGLPIVGDRCLVHRNRALDAAIAGLAKHADDPWPLVRSIDECEAIGPSPRAAAIRTELGDATAARAEALAEEARKLGDDRLVTEALEAAGSRALTAGDAVTAERLLRLEATTSDRASDDAARARALLGLLEVARWNGDNAAAVRDDDALRAILARHGNARRDELVASLQQGKTFTDVGNVERAMSAWDRAIDLAKNADSQLAARAGHAWALFVLRFELVAARDEIAVALADLPSASVAARTSALVVQGDLALAAGDGATARTAFADAHDPLRSARARGLTGDVDGALAELAALDAIDRPEAQSIRVVLARAQILRAAKRAREAQDLLKPVVYEVRLRTDHDTQPAPPLALLERLDIMSERCEVDIELAAMTATCESPLLATLHPLAPLRARLGLARVRDDRAKKITMLVGSELDRVLAILVAAKASPVLVAEVHWELAQDEHQYDSKVRRAHAIAARTGFEAAGRATELAAIDRWLATGDADAGVSAPPSGVATPDAATPDADPW